MPVPILRLVTTAAVVVGALVTTASAAGDTSVGFRKATYRTPLMAWMSASVVTFRGRAVVTMRSTTSLSRSSSRTRRSAARTRVDR